jgi:hypothetical protein
MPLPLPSRFLLVYYLCTEFVYWIQLAPDRNECRGYEHFNESSSSTQGGQFLDQLYKYQLHKTDGSCMESVPVNEPRPLPSTSASCRSVHRTCPPTDCSKKYNTSQPISKPPKHRSVLLQTIRSSPQHRVLFWGPHSPLPNVYRGFDPNTKRQRHEVYRLPPCSTEDKISGSYTTTPPTRRHGVVLNGAQGLYIVVSWIMISVCGKLVATLREKVLLPSYALKM